VCGRGLPTVGDVALIMVGYAHLDLDEIDFAPMQHDAERLRLLTLDETYDLIRVLRTVAGEADRLAGEIGARIPSESRPCCRPPGQRLRSAQGRRNTTGRRTSPW
jgi:hypothetical protein